MKRKNRVILQKKGKEVIVTKTLWEYLLYRFHLKDLKKSYERLKKLLKDLLSVLKAYYQVIQKVGKVYEASFA